MEYIILGRTGLEVSKVGIGGEWLNGVSREKTIEIIEKAMERGINFIDVFMPQPETRSNIGYGIKNRRQHVIIQGHFGTIFENNQYCRTRDLKKTKKSFEDLLTRLNTDYIDIGMLHYIDTYEDYNAVFESEIIEYVKTLKLNGIVKFIGMSSHNPSVSLKAVKSGIIDVLMFSINPAYDMESTNTKYEELRTFSGLREDGWVVDPIRQKLYSECEHLGVSITVMKALASGSLLNSDISPFNVAMTVNQCIHYCFTRPGVKSIFIGVNSIRQVEEAVNYFKSSDEEKDFSEIFEGNNKIQISGRCMYCNHCLPCPSYIDIASINKFLDLAIVKNEIPETVKDHYSLLSKHGEDCIKCGKCEKNCPFGVEIMDRMKLAVSIFGK